MGRSFFPALLLFVCAGAAPADAQVEQTTDGAQRFLELTTAAGGLTYTTCEDGTCAEQVTDRWTYYVRYNGNSGPYCTSCPAKGQVMRTEDRQSLVTLPERDIQSMKAKVSCHWEMNYNRRDVVGDGSEQGDLSYQTSTHTAEGQWSKVSQIEAKGFYVHFEWDRSAFVYGGEPGRQQARLRTLSPEQASRIAYAMEFLRVHCDPTAATGF